MEILNTYSTYNEAVNFFILLSVSSLFISTMFWILLLFYKDFKASFYSFLVISLSLILLYGLEVWHNKTEIKHYEVIITDYNQVDFGKYQVESKKGKITVLKEIK